MNFLPKPDLRIYNIMNHDAAKEQKMHKVLLTLKCFYASVFKLIKVICLNFEKRMNSMPKIIVLY